MDNDPAATPETPVRPPAWPPLAGARRWVRAEIGLLAALLACAGGVLAFVALLDEVGEGDTRAFDAALIEVLRVPGNPAQPIGPWWVGQMMRDLTSLGSMTVLTIVTVLALGAMLLERRRRGALFVLLATGGGALLSTAVKMAVDRPRPDLVAHLVDVRTASFPSGHAMLSAVTYLTLGALLARGQANRRMAAFIMGAAIALTLAIGASRVYLGVHWPTDVLAGWALGAAWAILWWTLDTRTRGAG